MAITTSASCAGGAAAYGLHMKILVFGATGATGKELVEQAVAAGHEVTVFARTPLKITVPGVRVVAGDVLDAAAVDRAIPGHDGVLVALGSKLDGKDRTLSLGTRHIIDSMKRHGVSRLVIESAWGSGDSAQYGGFFLNKILRPLLLKHPYAEHELQEAAVAATDLDWTVVRPGRLTNDKKQRTLNGGRLPTGLQQKAARSEVADFMLREVSERRFPQQAILIG